jgi:hypothetical protein
VSILRTTTQSQTTRNPNSKFERLCLIFFTRLPKWFIYLEEKREHQKERKEHHVVGVEEEGHGKFLVVPHPPDF